MLSELVARWGGPVPDETMLSWTEALLDLSDAEFRSLYGDTPYARPGREGLLRNLCVGLGNSGDQTALPLLMRCLHQESPVVREHATWAIGRLDAVRRDLS